LRGHALLLNLAGVSGTPERFDEGYYQDPQAYFAALRQSRPVAPVSLPGFDSQAWLITRYEDVRAALADPRLAKDPRKLYPEWEPPPMAAMISLHMLNLDPPDHTRLRRLVQKAFTPRRVASLRPRVEEITTGLLDDMAAGPPEADLLDTFAFPLPITVICELLGIPVADRDDFRDWTAVIISSAQSPEEFQRAAGGMFGYFTSLLAAKRRSPADDLLSALILARDEGDRLTERELYSMVFLLLVAGFETTVNLIGSGALALMSFPAQARRLRADPSLLPAAIEELLRYANPLNHATERFTLDDVAIGGAVIPAGQWVLVATSSANRDPERFPDPERLDVGRDASGHVAFGHGIHHCLGAPLARLEGEIAIGSLLARFPSLSLAVPASQLRWRQSSLIHGLESLPVRLS
jgi:cytochrome P450